METPQTFWATCTSAPYSKKVLNEVQRKSPMFQFVSIASYSGSGHY